MKPLIYNSLSLGLRCLYWKNPLRIKPCMDVFKLCHKVIQKSTSIYPIRLVYTILDFFVVKMRYEPGL